MDKSVGVFSKGLYVKALAKRRNSLSLTLLLCVMGLIPMSASPGRCADG